MLFLGENGYRAIAHDRRDHGRTSQPWNGNEMDTYVRDTFWLQECKHRGTPQDRPSELLCAKDEESSREC
jgi:alpha-beta hydrolase superfamily lysophospholipase